MNFLKKIILVLIFLFPISNSFGSVTFNQTETFFDDGQDNINGLTFNDDGTKIFIITSDGGGEDYVSEYTLSTPYDISTRSYAGDSERCLLDAPDDANTDVAGTQGAEQGGDMAFSSDGLIMLTTNRGTSGGFNDFVLKFTLTTAYDVSTCSYDSVKYVDTDALQDGATDLDGTTNLDRVAANKHYLSGIAIKPDGTKIFLNFNDASGDDKDKDSIKEYTLSTAFDLSTMTLETTAIQLHATNNPEGMSFSNNGKRLFLAYKAGKHVAQFSLPTAYSLVGAVLDGTATPLNSSGSSFSLGALGFNGEGLKLYVSSFNTEDIFEFDLACPFNIISGKCTSITENSDRTGMAEAQVELAKRTINFSTNSALNRLKWIRRNKDKQNLSNQNIKLNFSNSLLSSLKAVPISSFKKISTFKNKKDSNKNYFYWSEGSISLGKVGDTSIASTKEVNTNALTFGLDRLTDDYGLEGLAFRFGNDDVDVGSAGSNLDSNTYNIMYYSSSPIKDDTKYLDKIFGIGKIRSDITNVLDGKSLTADRTGNQIYGTFKIKDEYKRDKLTFIPSGQFDFGHTILRGYQEAGTGAIEVEDQHIRTKNIRATMSVVEDLSSDKYTLKRHGKLEYVAELDRSSNFKYTYIGDGSVKFNDTLHTGALHNLNGEIGIDIIFPEKYSVFIIYERNHAFGTGYTDNLYIALGYLPHEDTEYAFSLNGSDNLMSKFEIKKNINGYDLTFNLNDDLTNLGNSKEASINLNKVF
mgnify:CR=1 FL=1